MNQRRALVELVGGVAGALVMLLLVFGTKCPIWIATPIGLVTYVAIRLLKSERAAESAATRGRMSLSEARVQLAAIRRLERAIEKPGVRTQVREIADFGELIARAIEEDAAWEAAVQLSEQILGPCAAMLTGYLRLVNRGAAGAEAVIAKTEDHDLAVIRQSLDELYERLNRGHVIELAVMSEMVELSRAGIGYETPRRMER